MIPILLILACTGGDKVADSAAIGTSGGDTSGGDTRAPVMAAVVTDIDGTLTTSNAQFLQQLVDPDYDPEMRPDANTLMQAFSANCFTIFYITGRGQDITLLDGRSATEATSDWLDEHGFPRSTDDLTLATGLGATGSAVRTYKAETIEALQAEGWEIRYAYGNADTDVEAYQDAGIPDEHIFLVGELAGQMGVQGITDGDAYTNYLASMPTDSVCAR